MSSYPTVDVIKRPITVLPHVMTKASPDTPVYSADVLFMPQCAPVMSCHVRGTSFCPTELFTSAVCRCSLLPQ